MSSNSIQSSLELRGNMLASMNKMVNTMNRLSTASQQARTSLEQLSHTQESTNSSMDKGKSKAEGLSRSLRNLITTYFSYQAAVKATEIVDDYTLTNARIKLVNDGLQTQKQLQQDIYNAAQRTGTSYGVVAASVSKLGLLAKDSFRSNQEALKFSELMQKAFTISGASTQEKEAGMYQLTQAMAAGKLQGDEFRSIMENAPMLANAIATYMGKTKGELKTMSSEGKITANVIKAALFNAADDINKKFAEMPSTFGMMWNRFKNAALIAFDPVIRKLNALVNNPGFIKFMNTLLVVLSLAANLILSLMTDIGNVINFITTNWSVLEPIFIVISAYLLAWAITMIPALIAQFNAMCVKLWLMVAPILAQAGAWLAVNWPLVLIIALIGLLIYALLRFRKQTVQVIGVVGGLFGVFFAFLFNKWAMFTNIALSVAEFFANVFRDPVYAVKKLFFDMTIEILKFFVNIADGIENIINKIPGMKVSMTQGLHNILGTLQENRDKLKSDKDVVKLMRFEQIKYDVAFNKGQQYGEKAGNVAADLVGNAATKLKALIPGTGSLLGDINNKGLGDLLGGKLDKTNDLLSMSKDEMDALLELAEAEIIHRNITLTPTVQVTTGDIKSEVDVDNMISKIAGVLDEHMSASSSRVAIEG